MKSLFDGINRIVLLIVYAGFIISFSIISVQVGLRYLLSYGLVWGEELARYLNIFIVLLGASVVVLEDVHPRIETIFEMLPQKAQRVIGLLFNFLIMVLLVFIIQQGISLCIFSWDDYTSAMRIRWTFPYLSIPIGGGLMLIQLLNRWMRDAAGRKRDNSSS